jgi:hypothetical protein
MNHVWFVEGKRRKDGKWEPITAKAFRFKREAKDYIHSHRMWFDGFVSWKVYTKFRVVKYVSTKEKE